MRWLHVFAAGPGTIPEEVPTLSYWCFEPGVAMRALEALKVRCVLLTSGTLSPLDSFAQELQLDFPISLENPHVIADSQVGFPPLTCPPTVSWMASEGAQ